MLLPLSIYADYEGLYRLISLNQSVRQISVVSQVENYHGFQGQRVERRLRRPKRIHNERRTYHRVYLETRSKRERRRINRRAKAQNQSIETAEQSSGTDSTPNQIKIDQILGVDERA